MNLLVGNWKNPKINVITGAITCTSWEKLYKELSLEFVKFRWTLRRQYTFYKIISTGLSSCSS